VRAEGGGEKGGGGLRGELGQPVRKMGRREKKRKEGERKVGRWEKKKGGRERELGRAGEKKREVGWAVKKEKGRKREEGLKSFLFFSNLFKL
jgi:hypothetical protein